MDNAEIDPLLKQAYDAYQVGAFARSRAALERVLEHDPTHLDALAALSNTCQQMGDTTGPLAFLERARAATPDNEMILILYVDALIADQKHQQAFDIANEAATLFPDNAMLRIQVARGWMGTGESDKARAGLWAAFESDPTNVNALYYLARIGDNSDLPRLEPLLDDAWSRRKTLEPPAQMILAFARATVAEKQARIDEAWDAYVAGNEIHRSLVPFDEEGYIGALNEQLQLFGNVAPLPTGTDAPGGNLVFIVSLPRSGSTLTEQILASHSRVKTIGERALVYDAFHIWNRSRTPAALEDARRAFREGAYALLGISEDEDTIILDKSITNYIYLGFLRLLFPGANFVHVVRAPMDTGFSCFATAFGMNALKWCSDLGAIGRVFRRYQKLMKVWTRQDRGDLLTLSYEELTADPETKVRALVAFCGLPWEPACLKFHENKRQVATASASQVRRPIYKTAQGRAAPFEAHLTGLRRVLGRAADPDWYKKP